MLTYVMCITMTTVQRAGYLSKESRITFFGWLVLENVLSLDKAFFCTTYLFWTLKLPDFELNTIKSFGNNFSKTPCSISSHGVPENTLPSFITIISSHN